MAYGIEAIPMTLGHIQGHSYCKPLKCNFSQLTGFQLTHSASRGPSAVAELLAEI